MEKPERLKPRSPQQSLHAPEEAGSRGPLARLLLALTVAACLLAAATALYGIYNFPDAPLRQTAGGYAGKGGTPRTQDDYEAFIRWEKAMLTVFPTAFVIGFAFVITDSRQRRQRRE
ncbi:MAG: hypothetical protein WCF57_20745 [Pyrinomonadaceae bacterium]